MTPEVDSSWMENFFVLDSNNIHEVESRLYGYCIMDGKICEGKENVPEEVSPDGVYVHIFRHGAKVTISQDYIGSFGLYFYRRGGYFAISNSFVKLAEWLRPRESLHMNMDYIMSMFVFDLCSLSVGETPLQEISMLPRNARVHINIETNTLSIERIDYQEESVPIDSEQGMAILDEWHEKYTGLIRNLKSRTNNIGVDLSGGFDSRITFSLFVSADIDMNEVRISSVHDDLHTHAEDYEIASEIANFYHISLNQNVFSGGWRNFPMQDIVDISFYTKLGFHKQMLFQYGKHGKPVYSFGGWGGETLRDYWNMTPDDFISWQSRRGDVYILNDVKEATARILKRSIHTLSREYGLSEDDPKVVMRLYLESRSRNHFGKAAVEWYFSHHIKISPLMDRKLHMLRTMERTCGDRNFLFCLILARYAKDLLDFRLEGGRSFEAETMQAAKAISRKYPFKKMAREIVSKEVSIISAREDKGGGPARVKNDDIHKEILEHFQSQNFRERFMKIFSEDIYYFAQRYERNNKYFPLQYIYSTMAAEYAMNVEENSNRQYSFVTKKDKNIRGGGHLFGAA